MVDGNATRDFVFVDETTNQKVSVTLTWKDGIHLKLLERLINAVSNAGDK